MGILSLWALHRLAKSSDLAEDIHRCLTSGAMRLQEGLAKALKDKLPKTVTAAAEILGRAVECAHSLSSQKVSDNQRISPAALQSEDVGSGGLKGSVGRLCSDRSSRGAGDMLLGCIGATGLIWVQKGSESD